MVKDGVVTLAGHLDSFSEKHAVERAAGVRGIALELDVKLAAEHKRSDSEIAQSAVTALPLNPLVPDGKAQVEVEDGWVTLIGEVEWSYQLAGAKQCIRPIAGVRGLDNRIAIAVMKAAMKRADWQTRSGVNPVAVSAEVAIPAAIANAIYDATGARIRSVPFAPEKVLAALKLS